MTWRTFALTSGGYCEGCEFMTANEVMAATLMTRQTLLAMERRGELHVVRIGSRHTLYHRADVQQTIVERGQEKRAWLQLIRHAA
jgi:hypothetical protein